MAGTLKDQAAIVGIGQTKFTKNSKGRKEVKGGKYFAQSRQDRKEEQEEFKIRLRRTP